jgi:pentatricopeptide repeat protein
MAKMLVVFASWSLIATRSGAFISLQSDVGALSGGKASWNARGEYGNFCPNTQRMRCEDGYSRHNLLLLKSASQSIPEYDNTRKYAQVQKSNTSKFPRTSDRKSRIDYNQEITALGNSGQWKQALALMDSMASEGCQPNVVTYNAIMSVLVKNGEWNQTLQIFEKLRGSKLTADTRSFSVAVSACSKGRKWQKALDLLAEMEAAGVKPNEFTYRQVRPCAVANDFVHGTSPWPTARAKFSS